MKNKLFLFLLILWIFDCNVSTSSFKEGKFLFERNCASCHGLNAEGLGKWYPNLYDTAYLRTNRKLLASFIRIGISRDSNAIHHSRFKQVDMPENKYLAESDICNILNYLNELHWKQENFTIMEVQESLKDSIKK